ncbi:hypothetical protein LZC95_19435 [Pendulispora brunnea]|uniref:Uncharacterized protein n=1 Tax=Pendulispora brunnea TaxID=2905690 RepID=A0ABZ2KN04_9BACT
MMIRTVTQNAARKATPRTHSFGGRPEHTPLGLSVLERERLHAFFCEYESAIGFRSTFREMIVVLAWGDVPSGMAVHASRPAVNDAEDRMLERIALGVVGPARKIYQALSLMASRGEGALVSVLWLLHGHRHPTAAYHVFSDVAPIVHLTDAAEEVREKLALHDGDERYDRVTRDYPTALAAQREAITAEFWRTVGLIHRADERVGRWTRRPLPRKKDESDEAYAGRSKERESKVQHYTRMRLAWWRLLEQLLRAYDYDGTTSASNSAVAEADREATPQAAIRWRLAYRGPRVNGRPVHQAMKAHQIARAAFVASARRSAEKLRIRAALAYRSALAEVSEKA